MKGIGVSPGIVINKAYILKKNDIKINNKKTKNPAGEIKKFEAALNDAEKQLKDIINNTCANVGQKEADIFEAQKMILCDIEFINKIKDKILNNKMNSVRAIELVSQEYIKLLAKSDNEYIRQRTVDIEDVVQRVKNILQGNEFNNINQLEKEVIIVTDELSPSDLVLFDSNIIRGFVTEKGGLTSHSSILARAMDIPAVVGIKEVTTKIKNDEIIIIDGKEGDVFSSPGEDLIKKYKIKIREQQKFQKMLENLKGQETKTSDGFRIELFANITNSSEIKQVKENDGEGIGLFRSEFLYMDRKSPPTEEEQFNIYKKTAEKMNDKPVIIRTLDAGGDKDISYLDLPEEMNPFLGLRAIRLCLNRLDIFKTQIRAILRASVFGDIKLMFPMIVSINELKQAKKILKDTAAELDSKGIEYNKNIQIGMMVETPAAAVMADHFAREVDFFSIGTNDLIQYTGAVDRLNNNVSYLYSPFNPAVLRLINNIIKCGHNHDIKVSICGETASNLKLIPLFIGMGIDELSVSSNLILNIRRKINSVNKNAINEKVKEVLNCSTPEEVINILNNTGKILG